MLALMVLSFVGLSMASSVISPLGYAPLYKDRSAYEYGYNVQAPSYNYQSYVRSGENEKELVGFAAPAAPALKLIAAPAPQPEFKFIAAPAPAPQFIAAPAPVPQVKFIAAPAPVQELRYIAAPAPQPAQELKFIAAPAPQPALKFYTAPAPAPAVKLIPAAPVAPAATFISQPLLKAAPAPTFYYKSFPSYYSPTFRYAPAAPAAFFAPKFEAPASFAYKTETYEKKPELKFVSAAPIEYKFRAIEQPAFVAPQPALVAAAQPTFFAQQPALVPTLKATPAQVFDTVQEYREAGDAFLTKKTQYHTQNELGEATYGHSEPNQSHSAVQDAAGNKAGTFSYIGPDGRLLTTNYIADQDGYRVASNALPKNENAESAPILAAN